MPGLKRLTIINTQVTGHGVKRLWDVLPNCYVR